MHANWSDGKLEVKETALEKIFEITSKLVPLNRFILSMISTIIHFIVNTNSEPSEAE